MFLGLCLLFDQHHGGAEHHSLTRTAGDVDDPAVGQLALQLGQSSLNEALAFLRRIVFGVFAQVAVCAGFRDGLDDPRSLHLVQPIQFGLQRFVPFSRDRCRHIFPPMTIETGALDGESVCRLAFRRGLIQPEAFPVPIDACLIARAPLSAPGDTPATLEWQVPF
ncbi:hypothetical protein NSPZN2_40355 [Nitrospira defluvii]|uniref:Uncharacterized protein n=1 Tax=Nitrospira defluvii TaxID=330214 RepID=A0ABM8RUM5_9BACT|nr:hypothetical protein NSPZN2_40355 [Nitrospira defluvii]